MIEMQYNFPLLPGQGEQWKSRLEAAVRALHGEDANELRPTFRMGEVSLRVQREMAGRWLGVTGERADQVWITCGGHHGTLLALLAGGLAGRAIAVEEVTYTGILEQGRMLGSRLVGVGFDGEGMVPEALREVCEREAGSGSGVRAIYAMPTVQNPLGCVAGLERRRAIVEIAREFDLLIVEDDAYGYMEADAPPNYAELAPERAFYVRGLSKSYAPATRTGFLVAPELYAPAVEGALKSTTTGTSLVHNVAALSLIADGTLDAMMAQKRAEGARRNAAARMLLGEAAGPDVVASGARCAWHLWVRLRAGLSAEAAQEMCGEHGVMVSGAQGFTAPGCAVPGALRIALGGEVDFARMLEGVSRVAGVVRLQA